MKIFVNSIMFGFLVTYSSSMLMAQQSPWSKIGTNIHYSSGKVGIGTDSPEKTLDIDGTLRMTGYLQLDSSPLKMNNTDTNSKNFWLDNTGSAFEIQLLEGTNWSTGNPSIPLRIANDGKVTIGTDVDEAELHVDGTLTSLDFTAKKDVFMEGTNPYFRLLDTSISDSKGYKIVNAGNKLQFQVLNETSNAYEFSPIVVYGESGNVTMGTGAIPPDFTVNINGALWVQNAGSGDYIFYDDYNLMPIKELEEFVDEHNHLPEIPPASETEQGVDIGSFSIQLLKKIEELTLYTIDQNERLESLESEVEKLAKKSK